MKPRAGWETPAPRPAAQGSGRYLEELPGLPAELGAVVLAHDHQHGAGWTPGLRGRRLQVPLCAVPPSILPGARWEGGQGERNLTLSSHPPCLPLHLSWAPASGEGGLTGSCAEGSSQRCARWAPGRRPHSSGRRLEGETTGGPWQGATHPDQFLCRDGVGRTGPAQDPGRGWGGQEGEGERDQNRGPRSSKQAGLTASKPPGQQPAQAPSSGPVGEGEREGEGRLPAPRKPLRLGVTPRSVGQFTRSIMAARWAPAECPHR